MVRIVGIQRSEDVKEEFVLLQNQGGMRTNLRGLALLAEATIDEPPGLQESFIIREDIFLQPGQYALIRSCHGTPRWSHTHEGYSVYYSYLSRQFPIWNRYEGAIHVLAPSHTFVDRSAEALYL